MQQNRPRMTTTTVDVLEVFDHDPASRRYGLEMMSLTGLPSGTVFPILARFERLGWLESGWEDGDDARMAGRPARRYYRLTSDGRESTREALVLVRAERARRRALLRRPVPDIAGGLA